MAGLEIVPFTDEHVAVAASLLAERHARHRDVEPLLPNGLDFVQHVRGEWETEGSSGAVALEGGEPVGYLIGQHRDDAIGPHIWSHVAGQAVRTPEVARDLYRLAATRWVDEGLTRHFVFVPALPDLIEPWFRLSFGASAALATRETGGAPVAVDGVTVRRSTPADLDAAASFDRLLGEHLKQPPSFGGLPVPALREYVDDWRDTWDEEERYTHFVAERKEAVVGHLLLYRRPADLRVPADGIDLANCATEPGLRGSGVGVALTTYALAWAREHGYPTMITDWRMTNLEASRFWPRRGFRETFLRVYRSIP